MITTCYSSLKLTACRKTLYRGFGALILISSSLACTDSRETIKSQANSIKLNSSNISVGKDQVKSELLLLAEPTQNLQKHEFRLTANDRPLCELNSRSEIGLFLNTIPTKPLEFLEFQAECLDVLLVKFDLLEEQQKKLVAQLFIILGRYPSNYLPPSSELGAKIQLNRLRIYAVSYFFLNDYKQKKGITNVILKQEANVSEIKRSLEKHILSLLEVTQHLWPEFDYTMTECHFLWAIAPAISTGMPNLDKVSEHLHFVVDKLADSMLNETLNFKTPTISIAYCYQAYFDALNLSSPSPAPDKIARAIDRLIEKTHITPLTSSCDSQESGFSTIYKNHGQIDCSDSNSNPAFFPTLRILRLTQKIDAY